MPSTVHQAREALGQALRELRRDAGLTGRQLATLAGWHSSKVSKIEYGKQNPSEDDIRAWCRLCDVADQANDLIAVVRSIESMYVEWRRNLRTGTRRRQAESVKLEAETRLFRWFEPVLVPGIFHTAEYAAGVLARVIEFYGIPDDLEAGVLARMERQQILYKGDHRFHVILAQQALWTVVDSPAVTIGQLDRLLAISSLARVSLGILPARSVYQVPTNQFIIFDDRMVHVEAVSAELTIMQPREIALYAKAFQTMSKAAVYGPKARALISDALRALAAD
ncbi:helix-turn-helix domain-containing protein [Sphaerisporangium corydalis]|uniref:Helix-turn-helix domain-containing protein n=1 Tax=Sphaerisporangium corydalis TaxID=1441875 RepID=A0ABV9EEP8_9ACTN|nr:helix-turn-helix transcriptional regulator [Sphaerisporangium corydalis]